MSAQCPLAIGHALAALVSTSHANRVFGEIRDVLARVALDVCTDQVGVAKIPAAAISSFFALAALLCCCRRAFDLGNHCEVVDAVEWAGWLARMVFGIEP